MLQGATSLDSRNRQLRNRGLYSPNFQEIVPIICTSPSNYNKKRVSPQLRISSVISTPVLNFYTPQLHWSRYNVRKGRMLCWQTEIRISEKGRSPFLHAFVGVMEKGFVPPGNESNHYNMFYSQCRKSHPRRFQNVSNVHVLSEIPLFPLWGEWFSCFYKHFIQTTKSVTS